MADQTPNQAEAKAAADAKAKAADEEAKALAAAEEREKAEKAKLLPKKTSDGMMYRLKVGKHTYRNASGESVTAKASEGDFIPLTAAQLDAFKDRVHIPEAVPDEAVAEAGK